MRIRDSIHSDHHPNSYYVASVGVLPEFQRLEGSQRADVCIIGGGLTGINAAIELAQKGYDVILLEQNRIGWGASGRNGGQLLGGFGLSFPSEDKLIHQFNAADREKLFHWGQECVDIAIDRMKAFDIDCDLQMGFYDAAHTKRQLDDLRRYRDGYLSHGYPHKLELVEGESARQIVNSDVYVGGLVNHGWGHVHPLKLTVGEAAAAQQLGVRIYEDARVSAIIPGAPAIVDAGWARVTADYVIVAANGYQGDLLGPVAGKTVPVGSYIMATEPLSDDQAAQLFPKRVAVSDQRMVLDYYRLSADNRLLFGGLATYSGRHPKDIPAALMPGMLAVFPQLSDVKIDYSWGGYLSVGVNRVPQFGRIAPNIFYGHGYAGHGLAPSHLGGRLLAEVVSGTAERFDVMAGIRHMTIPGGWLSQPLFALGMWAIALRDKLMGG